MSSKKLRTIERLIIFTFPVVLFAGCAGSDVKPVATDYTSTTIPELQESKDDTPFPATDYPIVSLTKSYEANIDDSFVLEQENKPVEMNMTSMTDPVNASVETDNSTDVVKLTIPDRKVFYFDTNVHTLSNEQRDELRAHADYLISNPGSVLVINGHADERGSESYNQTLSEKRAGETFKLLTSLGVPQDQLVAKGFGEMVPMRAENNWDENRRIELEYSNPMTLSSM